MKKDEYASYEAAFAAFMAREGLQNLSSGHFQCPNCHVEFADDGKCPECGSDRESWNEPSFSWRNCDCCGTSLGGDRYYASGWNPTTKEICEYEYVCPDCIYYAEYGRLDDTTMDEIEQSEE